MAIPGWTPFVAAAPAYRDPTSPWYAPAPSPSAEPTVPWILGHWGFSPIGGGPNGSEDVQVVGVDPDIPRQTWDWLNQEPDPELEPDPDGDTTIVLDDSDFTPIDLDDEDDFLPGPEFDPPSGPRGGFLALLLVAGAILAAKQGMI
jgi:hypothetical protein